MTILYIIAAIICSGVVAIVFALAFLWIIGMIDKGYHD